MPISVTQTVLYLFRTHEGVLIARARLDVTGLTAGSENSVPHGIVDYAGSGTKPLSVELEPTAANSPYQSQIADETNMYLTVAADGATQCSAYVEWATT